MNIVNSDSNKATVLYSWKLAETTIGFLPATLESGTKSSAMHVNRLDRLHKNGGQLTGRSYSEHVLPVWWSEMTMGFQLDSVLNDLYSYEL